MNRFVIVWGVITISLCLYGINEMTGVLCYYIDKAYRDYRYAHSNHVVRTEFYDKHGFINAINGDGNILSETGENGPYTKMVVFRDGSCVWVQGGEYATWGSGEDLK